MSRVAGQVQGGKMTKNQKKKKKRYSGQHDEPHLVPNEKTQPLQWTERPTGALVAAGSLCPTTSTAGTVALAIGVVSGAGSGGLFLNFLETQSQKGQNF